MFWQRNVLQSCCCRAGELLAWLGDNPIQGLLSVSLMPSSSLSQPDRVLPIWHGCPGQQKYKRNPRALLHVHKPTTLCPIGVPDGLLFGALGPRLVGKTFKKRIMIRSEVHPPKSSITSIPIVSLIVEYSSIFWSFSHESGTKCPFYKSVSQGTEEQEVLLLTEKQMV